jgi:hypothetical protein
VPDDINQSAIVRIPLHSRVTADELRHLLWVLVEYYDTLLWLERAERRESGIPEPRLRESNEFETLAIEFLTIGTPNEVQLKGPVAQMTAIVALLAAVIALPKLPLDREQLRASIAKTEAETRVVELQAMSAELEIIERAKRLQAEGRISPDDLAQQLERLRRVRPALPYAAGVVRDTATLESPEQLAAERLRVKLLERARALGANDPSLNLFLAVFAGDASLVEPALRAGADPNLPFYELVRRLPEAITIDPEFRNLLGQLLVNERREK